MSQGVVITVIAVTVTVIAGLVILRVTWLKVNDNRSSRRRRSKSEGESFWDGVIEFFSGGSGSDGHSSGSSGHHDSGSSD